MVTEISGVGLGHSVIGQAGAAVAQRSGAVGVLEDAGYSQPTLVSGDKRSGSTQVAGVYARLLERQDTLNKAASTVRAVGGTVEQAGQLLGKVEEKLGQIVKMYPPYPIDNPVRIQLLNKIDGLRQQIEQLTYPPAATVDTVGRLLGTKTDTASKETDAPSTTGGDKESMWNLPVLDPKTASDAEVRKALDQVKAVKTTLRDMQAGMWQDMVSYVKPAVSPEAQATDVRMQLADLGKQGIGSNASQLVQATES